LLFRDQGGVLAAEVRHGGFAAAKWVTRTIADNDLVDRKWRDRVWNKNNTRDYCRLDRRKHTDDEEEGLWSKKKASIAKKQ
jgi:hypothetical protein